MTAHKTNKFTHLFIEIFARVWALWGLITFVATFLIIFIPSMCSYLIKGKKGQVFFIAVSKVWMEIWLFLIGCTLKVVGKENFKTGETYIVTANHNTFLDVPISCPFIPGANKTIAKDSFAKVPLFGMFYKRGGVMVNRKSDKSRRESFYEMREVLANKIHMSIFPEGTRNKTKEPLKAFYDGAFKLAQETNTAIIPTLMFNTGKAMPVTKAFYLLPTKIEIHFLEPVDAIGINAKELKQKVFDIMLNYYVANK